MTETATLLLLGGGHAHVQVVTALPSLLSTSSVRVVLISDCTTSTYSGLLPSVVAGLLPESSSQVHLPSLCARNSIKFIQASIVHIDVNSRKVHLRKSNMPLFKLSYDYLSINLGSTTLPVASYTPTSPSKLPVVVYTRPIQNLSGAIDNFSNLSSGLSASSHPIVVIGAGAAGIELSFCLSSRFPRHPVTLVSDSKRFHSQYGSMPSAHIVSHLHARNITTHFGSAVIAIDSKTALITLQSGHQIHFSLLVLATGAAPHAMLTKTELPLDQDNWLLVNSKLQIQGHPNIFAAGDCISFGHSQLPGFPPKAGVYAVREGPILAHNLAVAITKRGKMNTFSPQSSFLSLLTTGDGRAIGTKYGIVFSGSWVFRLKMHIDLAWLKRFDEAKDGGKKRKEGRRMWNGDATEAAALLGGGENVHPVSDCFDDQLEILVRMDKDDEFREAVVRTLNNET